MKTDEGYELRQAGRRVVEAVPLGEVTEAPVIKRTQIDQPCQPCRALIEVSFSRRRVETFCTKRRAAETV